MQREAEDKAAAQLHTFVGVAPSKRGTWFDTSSGTRSDSAAGSGDTPHMARLCWSIAARRDAARETTPRRSCICCDLVLFFLLQAVTVRDKYSVWFIFELGSSTPG